MGCVKMSVRSLPDVSHVYGYRRPGDPEGVGESTYIRLIPSFFDSTMTVICV